MLVGGVGRVSSSDTFQRNAPIMLHPASPTNAITEDDIFSTSSAGGMDVRNSLRLPQMSPFMVSPPFLSSPPFSGAQTFITDNAPCPLFSSHPIQKENTQIRTQHINVRDTRRSLLATAIFEATRTFLSFPLMKLPLGSSAPSEFSPQNNPFLKGARIKRLQSMGSMSSDNSASLPPIKVGVENHNTHQTRHQHRHDRHSRRYSAMMGGMVMMNTAMMLDDDTGNDAGLFSFSDKASPIGSPNDNTATTLSGMISPVGTSPNTNYNYLIDGDHHAHQQLPNVGDLYSALQHQFQMQARQEHIQEVYRRQMLQERELDEVDDDEMSPQHVSSRDQLPPLNTHTSAPQMHSTTEGHSVPPLPRIMDETSNSMDSTNEQKSSIHKRGRSFLDLINPIKKKFGDNSQLTTPDESSSDASSTTSSTKGGRLSSLKNTIKNVLHRGTPSSSTNTPPSPVVVPNNTQVGHTLRTTTKNDFSQAGYQQEYSSIMNVLNASANDVPQLMIRRRIEPQQTPPSGDFYNRQPNVYERQPQQQQPQYHDFRDPQFMFRHEQYQQQQHQQQQQPQYVQPMNHHFVPPQFEERHHDLYYNRQHDFMKRLPTPLDMDGMDSNHVSSPPHSPNYHSPSSPVREVPSSPTMLSRLMSSASIRSPGSPVPTMMNKVRRREEFDDDIKEEDCDEDEDEDMETYRKRRRGSEGAVTRIKNEDSLLSEKDLDPSMINVGDEERPYKCNVCTKSFAHFTNLRRHVKLHSGNKPYTCEHSGCNKKFARRSDLQTHARIHTGERPFNCKFPGCTKSFTTVSNLRRHERTHDKKQV
jgi:hypothetical protein